MKSFAILLIGIGLGYVLFSYLNPSQTFTVTRTIHQTNTIPVQVNETRYHAPAAHNAVPKNEPAKIDIKVEPVIEQKKEIIQQADKTAKKEKSVLGKHKDDFGFKKFLGFNQIPFLANSDSKIKKIFGRYTGFLKFYSETRTGDPDKVIFKVNSFDTTFFVADAYDNPNENYSLGKSTAETFRALPGDENLLMLVANSEYSIVFDLRSFPDLKGKAYRLNVVVGEVELKKKRD